MSNDILPTEEESSQKQLKKLKQLTDSGITRDKTYRVLKDGMEATLVKAEYTPDGEQVMKEYPDHATRKGYLEIALKLFGDLEQEKNVVNVATINAQTSNEILKAAREAIRNERVKLIEEVDKD